MHKLAFLTAAAILATSYPAVADTAPFTITTVFPTSTVQSTGLQSPEGIAVDGNGNLYVCDPNANQVLRRSPSGNVTVFAGTGTAGFTGDSGAAVNARLNAPLALAIDSEGNLLIADSGNQRIRSVNSAGVITTVAGNPSSGNFFHTDGTPATSFNIGNPGSIAADGQGNFYFLLDLYTVLKVTPAGLAYRSFAYGLGPTLGYAHAVAVDASGNVYVLDSAAIYMRTAGGSFSTVTTDGTLYSARDLAFSPTHGVCYTRYGSITCVGSSGTAATLAGNEMRPGLGGDGGPATAAELLQPSQMAFDGSGNTFFADTGNDRVREINSNGIISTIMKGSPAVTVQYVRFVAADSTNNIYITDQTAEVVWKVSPDGTQSVFAGTGQSGYGGDGVGATDTTVFAPTGITADKNGNVYFTEQGSHTVREVTTDGIIHTIAGTGTAGFSGDGGQAKFAKLNNPWGIAVDSSENVFVADYYNNRIRRIDTKGIITTVAGSGPYGGFETSPSGGDGGPATSAQLNNPQTVAVSPNGTVYLTESARIRTFTVGGNINSFGKAGCSSGPLNGPVASVSFCGPAGMTFDSSGNMFVADIGNERVARIDPSGIVSNFAGTGVSGFSGDNGPALQAQLSGPSDVAFDGSGALYIADGGNLKIRRVQPGVPCSISLAPAVVVHDSGSLAGSFDITAAQNCSYTITSSAAFIHVSGPASGEGGLSVPYSVDMNAGTTARTGAVTIATEGAATVFNVYQSGAGCHFAFAQSMVSADFTSGGGYAQVNQTPSGCAAWQATSDSDWLTITGAGLSAGISPIAYTITNNPTTQSRTGVISIGTSTYTVTQAASPVFASDPLPGATLTCNANRFTWATGNADAFRYALGATPGGSEIASGTTYGGSVVVYGVPINGAPIYFSLWYRVGGMYWQPSAVTATYNTAATPSPADSCPLAPPPLGFFPITPCRPVDTRVGQSHTGDFGPPALTSGGTRNFALTSSGCPLPPSAEAFSLNFTVVPGGPLPYLSAWPTGQPYPNVSTLNSTDGSTLANAAIVPSGSGSITVLSGAATDLIVDANGYFAPPNGNELVFYPVTPCRVADTRTGQPFSGQFGPPSLAANATRNFPIQSGSCNIPSSAKAYSLNLTAVPLGPLQYLSAWPQGQPYPYVSSLNSPDGSVIANAAILPTGFQGGITVMAGNPADLIIDINGYFAPPGASDALHFYAVTPCRIADTRSSQPFNGAFGPPILNSSATRDFPIQTSCGIPSNARAFSLNITAVPQGPLPYLSVWPSGQPYPNVSTLNSPKGTIVANAAIVPAGANGAITVLSGGTTDLIIDINGYFAP